MEYSLRHDLIHIAPRTSTPVGWYPFTLSVQRILIIRGWSSIAASRLLAGFAGMALSGIVCGGIAIFVGDMWMLAEQKRRRNSISSA
jgi:hypothetical protein